MKIIIVLSLFLQMKNLVKEEFKKFTWGHSVKILNSGKCLH